MSSNQEYFEYPPSQRLAALFLFVIACLLPLVPAVIGFLVVVTVPPRMEWHEAISRLYHYFPNLISRNPKSVLLMLGGMWVFAVAATLPKIIIYSLVIMIDEDGIGAFLFDLRVKHLLWHDVKGVEGGTIREYDGLKWQTIKIIKIRTRTQRLAIRETILNFRQLFQMIREYAERYRIPTQIVNP